MPAPEPPECCACTGWGEVPYACCSFCTLVACRISSRWFQNADPPETRIPVTIQQSQNSRLFGAKASPWVMFSGSSVLRAVTRMPDPIAIVCTRAALPPLGHTHCLTVSVTRSAATLRPTMASKKFWTLVVTPCSSDMRTSLMPGAVLRRHRQTSQVGKWGVPVLLWLLQQAYALGSGHARAILKHCKWKLTSLPV